jgi:hypothetical protein
VDRFNAFSTPIFVYEISDVEELNRELADSLLREMTACPGVRRSNVGGWHSEPNLSHRAEPCYRTLLQLIVSHVSQTVGELAEHAGNRPPKFRYGVHGWAMVMNDGDYVILHDHG